MSWVDKVLPSATEDEMDDGEAVDEVARVKRGAEGGAGRLTDRQASRQTLVAGPLSVSVCARAHTHRHRRTRVRASVGACVCSRVLWLAVSLGRECLKAGFDPPGASSDLAFVLSTRSLPDHDTHCCSF